MTNKKNARSQWYRVDLHLHTPASSDYHDDEAKYIDILRKAERRGLDIIAFTDHNTVGGYASMMEEIDRLRFLEQSGRALADELRLLAEYRRLLDKVLVLPGFEFSAAFGFHILAIFAPETPLRYIEHILLTLNVPPHVLEEGNPAAGATADVLECYRLVDEAGGIVIAAHANAAHGVAMRGLNFGGQTRIAYTQDRHLHALELTDLNKRGRGSTRRFFNGTKAEYPRQMHCIQGSDAHSIESFMEGKNQRLGVGERVTEMLLEDRSFHAIKEVLEGTDFARTRPYNANKQPFDYIIAARDEGPSLVQSFHEVIDRKGGKLHSIIADVCAFANTNGGTVYVGLSANKNKKPIGVPDSQAAISLLRDEISHVITPPLNVQIDMHETVGKSIIRILVPYGEERPYAINDNKIYLRDEGDTNLAVRDEIVNLVQQGLVFQRTESNSALAEIAEEIENEAKEFDITSNQMLHQDADHDADVNPPRAGVEIVDVEERNETRYFTMRDLRNGNTVKNVTRSSARRLWAYAIKQYEGNPVNDKKVSWQDNVGLWRRYSKGGTTRYDLVQRLSDGVHVYYGVTENGMHGAWEQFLVPDEENSSN